MCICIVKLNWCYGVENMSSNSRIHHGLSSDYYSTELNFCRPESLFPGTPGLFMDTNSFTILKAVLH